MDNCGDNGRAKINENYILSLISEVEHTPLDYVSQRLTWTKELLKVFPG